MISNTVLRYLLIAGILSSSWLIFVSFNRIYDPKVFGGISEVSEVTVLSPSALDDIIVRTMRNKDDAESRAIYEALLKKAEEKGLFIAPESNTEIAKRYIFVAVFLMIVLSFIWALAIITVSKSKAAIAVAQDAAKTLLGFFVGAATTFLGVG